MTRSARPARATKALVAELCAQGVNCSPRRLEDWRRVGLIPRGHRHSLGRGRGTEVVYPDDMAERCRRVAERMRRGQPWQMVTLSLFATGADLPEETIRAAYRWALSVDTPSDGDELGVAEHFVGQLLSTAAGRRLEALVAAHVKRSGAAPNETPASVAHSVLTNLFVIHFGGEVASDDAMIELLAGMWLPITELPREKQIEVARQMDSVMSALSVHELSAAEMALYEAVTTYVTEEMNRAERLTPGRRNVVGFALTVLQRRLASSPEAICQSLARRKKRLEDRLAELRVERSPTHVGAAAHAGKWDDLDTADLEDDDLDAAELEEIEERLVDQASAAETAGELEAEVATLSDLERLARSVLSARTDRKWSELTGLLSEGTEMFDASGARRKLLVFTEHRDTLNYLVARLQSFLGRPEAVVSIHGGMRPEQRRLAQDTFTSDPDCIVLAATDAAGEGINLQRAHLVVNCDLPWNPNRIEQRFGRVLRIGQEEVCHMWNLVAPRLAALGGECPGRRQDAGSAGSSAHVVSRRFEFVNVDRHGSGSPGGYAPYLDYRPATPDELALCKRILGEDWLAGPDLERRALDYGIEHIVPEHLAEVTARVDERAERTIAAVRTRLTREINYWDQRAAVLRELAAEGRQPKMNPERAQARADELATRMRRRLAELEEERQLQALPPVLVGAALVIPAGLLASLGDPNAATARHLAKETQAIEEHAMRAVLDAEAALGRPAEAMSHSNPGFDIRSIDAQGHLLLIEVKGRIEGSATVSVTRNEILTGLNAAERYVLALVEVRADGSCEVRYLHDPFAGKSGKLHFAERSTTFDWDKLWEIARTPR